ncbi:S41 family peptidase [Aquimarina algicola]|uniref:Tail specific protease domain-containing protein n=1 Tax=Aquimarina algicola TaxID=2589995 RepID=A0A504JK15_9FLAO|nr:S41 family peptidase [Aquimarina algicola]TPN87963.1 hypothetical protein FHK87_10345 [Aquimarina algicola]
MQRSALLFLFWIYSISFGIYAQTQLGYTYDEKFSPDSLRLWAEKTMNEVILHHPGMYRYTTKPKFDTIISKLTQSINDSLTTLEYYRKLKPIFAQIGCLHTSITLSEPFQHHYEEHLKFIPIEVFIDHNKHVFITKAYRQQQIPLQSRIISINNQPISEILDILYKAIPSDGYNETLKTLALNDRFPFWYQSIISTTDQYTIETEYQGEIQTYHLEGVPKETFPKSEFEKDTEKEQLVFLIKDDVAFLTIRSFATTLITDNGQNFRKFISTTFKTIQDQQIMNLVIDVRNNTGGTDRNAVFLTSHFFDQDFQYWKHVEVTEAVAKQIKGMYRVFYKKPKKIGDKYHWKGARWWLTKEFNYYKTQKPAKYNYNGNVYILTNGGCMSSCADVVALLSQDKKVKVVGEETGGGFQGNTSGLMPVTKVYPNMEMIIPLQKYTNAVDENINVGRGTIPDHHVPLTLENVMRNYDEQLEYVKQLIKKK